MSEKVVNKVNYSKSIIYKLVCNDPTITEFYIGSTTNFKNRKYSHKTDSNNKNSKIYNINLYKCIRENGNFENWSMIMIYEYIDCKSKLELHQKERYYIDLLKSTLNKNRPHITEEESKERHKKYYENNQEKLKEKSKERHKKYYENNQEKLKEKRKEYYEKNKEKAKEYAILNKELIIQKRKEYYEKNKETINEKARIKITCTICNSLINKKGLKAHQKTAKCSKFICIL